MLFLGTQSGGWRVQPGWGCDGEVSQMGETLTCFAGISICLPPNYSPSLAWDETSVA